MKFVCSNLCLKKLVNQYILIKTHLIGIFILNFGLSKGENSLNKSVFNILVNLEDFEFSSKLKNKFSRFESSRCFFIIRGLLELDIFISRKKISRRNKQTRGRKFSRYQLRDFPRVFSSRFSISRILNLEEKINSSRKVLEFKKNIRTIY